MLTNIRSSFKNQTTALHSLPSKFLNQLDLTIIAKVRLKIHSFLQKQPPLKAWISICKPLIDLRFKYFVYFLILFGKTFRFFHSSTELNRKPNERLLQGSVRTTVYWNSVRDSGCPDHLRW